MEKTIIKKLNKNTVANEIIQIVSSYYSSNIISINYLGGGSFGMAYKIVQDKEPFILVAKAYKVSGMHKKESFDLNLLNKNTIIKYPKVYFTHDANENINFDLMCMEYIEGKNVLNSFLLLFKSKKQKQYFAEKIVASMLETHSHTSEKFGSVEHPTYSTWLDYYKPFATSIFEEAKRLEQNKKLSKYILDAMSLAYEKFDEIFCEEVSCASLIHGDLNVMNIMVKKPFTITGIIDPLNSIYGDREYDLFQLNNLTGKCFYLYKTYKKQYRVSKNCDIKCAFYGLWNEVYCYIKSGTLFKLIMNPLVKNMLNQLKLSKL